ncbi:phosphatase [Aureococcus anophagefferens]|nr:phosphatase [Aureococcus anophagefferens]
MPGGHGLAHGAAHANTASASLKPEETVESRKQRKKRERAAEQKYQDDKLCSSSNIAAMEKLCGCNTEGLLLESALKEARALGDLATFVLFQRKKQPPDVRAQMPGWDPVACKVETLDNYAEAFAGLRREEISLAKKRTIHKGVSLRKALRGPGPPKITPMDIAKIHARSAGLTVPEWLEERKKRDENYAHEFEAASAELVADRLGDEAADDGRKKRRRVRKMERRLASMALVECVYVAQLAGGTHFQLGNPLKQVMSDLWWAPASTTENYAFLRSENITHVVNVSERYPNHFPDDFVYCRVRVNNDNDDAQDTLYEEYEMACRFIRQALDCGGRVVVSCPSGLDASATCLMAFLIYDQGVPLTAGYKILKVFEPEIGLSRQHALFLTLFEMDTMRRTSVSRNHRYLASPLFKLFHKFCPYAPVMSVGIYFALGYLQLPEPRYLAFGRPKFFADLHPELKQKAEKPKGGVPPGSLKVEVKYCGPVTLLVCLFVPCGTLACCFPCDKKAVYQAPDGQRYDRKGRKAVAHPVARALRAAGRGGAYAWDRVRYAYAATAAGAHFAYDAVDAVRRGGKLRPKPSHYLKEYYDRADAKAAEEPRVRLSLARDDQKLHVYGAGDAPAAGPGRRPSLAPLDRASSIQVQGAPGGLDKKPLAPIKRRSTVKVKKATSMRWDEATATSDGTEKSGNFGARKESIHWRRQAKQNEEYVDEASAS